MTETFGQRLKRICAERYLSQVALAKLVKVNSTTTSAWQRGQYAPDFWALVELAVKLDLSLDYLCCLTDEPRPLGYRKLESEHVCLQTVEKIPAEDVWRKQLYHSED